MLTSLIEALPISHWADRTRYHGEEAVIPDRTKLTVPESRIMTDIYNRPGAVEISEYSQGYRLMVLSLCKRGLMRLVLPYQATQRVLVLSQHGLRVLLRGLGE